MVMAGEQFRALVLRLENFAARNPRAYRLRVAFLALLAYAYVIVVFLAVLVIFLSLLLLLFFLNAGPEYQAIFFRCLLSIPVLLLLYFFCRSIFVYANPPAGVPISSANSPKLFELVSDYGRRLNCPRIDAVFLNADFNASIFSQSTFGFLGPKRHFLYLGLPLMQSLSPEQFKAVLAHELGHLSERNGKLGSWVYSVRTGCLQIIELRRAGGFPLRVLFERFFDWYSPFFNAYSLVLIRQHELEADRCAADLTAAKTAAHSLISSELKNRYIDLKYWKQLFRKIDDLPGPPAFPFRDLSSLMLAGCMDEDAYKWYKQSLRKITSLNQTHPALRDRIEAISKFGAIGSCSNFSEAELGELWSIEKSAAQEFFQDQLEEYERRMDIAWHHAYDENWSRLKIERADMRRQLEEYEAKLQVRNLSDEEILHRAQLYVQVKSAPESLVVLKQTMDKFPDNVHLNYNLGQLLLEQGDLSGIDYLEKTIALNPLYGYELCEIIYETLMEIGEESRANLYLDRCLTYYEDLRIAAQERSGLNPLDKFVTCRISDSLLAAVIAKLETFPEIKRAYLVCKEVNSLRERPFYVLLLETRIIGFRIVGSTELKRRIIEKLSKQLSLPSEAYVLDKDWAPANLKKAIKQSPSALVYERSELEG